MPLEWLYEARREFEELVAYYRARGGEEAARAFAERILDGVEALAAAPRAGTYRRDTLLGKHGFRTLYIGGYACIYRIEEGVVRIYHLTDAGKGELRDILGASGGDGDPAGAMRNSVFWKSALRQPVKMALLLAVTGLMAFLFVSRVSEYLLVRQETERLGAYYRPMGVLEGMNGAAREDASQALAYLEGSPFVQTAERRTCVSAVIQDGFCNADTSLTSDYGSQDVFFYGTLLSVGSNTAAFSVDTVLTGRPEYIAAGKESVQLWASPDIIGKACEGMVRGGRYLVRGRVRAVSRVETRLEFVRLLSLASPWYYAVPEGQEADFGDPLLAGVEAEIRMLRDNQRALHLVPTRDMTALPEIHESAPAIYLTGGRWLNRADDESGAGVCVVHAGFAKLRGLELGDSLSLRLRDIPSDFGYSRSAGEDGETADVSLEIVGLYEFTAGYAETFIRNQTYVPSSVIPASFQRGGERSASQMYFAALVESAGGEMPAAGEVTFQLSSPDRANRFLDGPGEELREMGYQLRLLENHWENFHQTAGPMLRSSLYNACIYTLLLAIVLCLAAFVYFRSHWRELAIARAMGVGVRRCAREASLPLLLAGLPGILAGGALGWANTLRNAAETLRSLAALDASGSGVNTAMPVYWLALLCCAALFLLLAATAGFAAILVRRPVLELLQGNTGSRGRPRSAALGREVPEGTPPAAGILSLDQVRLACPAIPAERSAARTAVAALRFVRRHIVRSPLKSLLASLLAAVFVVGLAAIYLAIESGEEKIDWLYRNTPVRMELLPESTASRAKNGGFLFDETIDAILDTGLFSDCYLEGAGDGAIITDPSLWNHGGPVSISKAHMKKEGRDTLANCNIVSIDDAEAFSTGTGSGANMPITYFDGWDAGMFTRDWAAEDAQAGADEAVLPIIIPRKWSARFAPNGEDAEELYPAGGTVLLNCKGSLRLYRVAGVHGSFEDCVLMPTSVLRMLAGERMIYRMASFTVDPEQNRDLRELRSLMDDFANASRIGSVPVNVVVWDEELRQAVEPLEESLELMRVLYPVVLALSLLAAAGTVMLFIMMSAKDAATLRVLGTPRGWTQAILGMQQIFTSAAGLLAGFLGVLVYAGRTRPELLAGLIGASSLCAMLYLLSAITGAAVSASAVTAKNPLELLQVRE